MVSRPTVPGYFRRKGARYLLVITIVLVAIGTGILESVLWKGNPPANFQYLPGLVIGGVAVAGLLLVQRWSLAAYPAEVWFSTEEQMAAFEEAVANATLLRRFAGRFHIRAGAAYTTGGLWWKIPLVLKARGQLSILPMSLQFVPLSYKNEHDKHDRNLIDGFAFELKPTEIISVDPYLRLQGYRSAYSLPWTRITTTRPAPLNSFLLAVGGRSKYGMDDYRQQALKLQHDLKALVA